MKIISKYILKSFLTSFLLTGLVLTFVLSIGFLFKVLEFLMKGASFSLVGSYLFASIPEVLGFTMPLALLVSSILVFGRLSSDNEIPAMKSCGVSFTTIMFWPVVFAFGCTILGFFIQNEVMPRGHFVRRSISNRLALESGPTLLEPGRFVNEIDDVSVFCASRDRNTLYNLLAIDQRDDFIREIRAEKADVKMDGNDLIFDLYNAEIRPPAKDMEGSITMGKIQYRYENALGRKKTYKRKLKDLYFKELVGKVNELKNPVEGMSDSARMKMKTQAQFIIQYRIVWALSSFCFVLVGIPLGIQGMRKENSRGLLCSLIIGISFFVFLMLAESLSTKPAAYPYLLVWLPVLICVATAAWIIPKNQ